MQRYTILEELIAYDEKNNLSSPITLPSQNHICQQGQLKVIKEQNDSQKSKVGRWNYDQQIIYLQFVTNNPIHLENKERRRSTKVFKQMAKLIPSRSADQCRSHHQKMEKKHGSIQNIISHCKKTLPKLKIKKNQVTKHKFLLYPDPVLAKQISQISIRELKTPVTQYTQETNQDNISEFIKSQQSQNFQFRLEEQQSCFLDFFNQNYQMPY